MRASILVLGPLLAKFGRSDVSLPGGCAIGSRPVDFHVNGLMKMGADIDVENGYIQAQVKGRLKGAHIPLNCFCHRYRKFNDGSGIAEGTTIIENAACEPEVEDLGEFFKYLRCKNFRSWHQKRLPLKALKV